MKCKNIDCLNQTIGKKLYCSLSCRNHYVNKYMRDYTKCSNTNKNKKTKREEEYLKNPNYCKTCKCIIPFDKKNDNIKFCSRSCSATFNNKNRPVTVNKKISEGVKSYIAKNGYFGALISKTNEQDKESKICINCSNTFTKNKIYCSMKCKREYERNTMDEFKQYRLDCNFKFNLSDFYEEYDFSLIDEYGWYSPSNKKNNIGGISRDHMFSVREGFDLKIDPKIISHPANCELLIHSKNISKHKKFSISLEDLLHKIEKFNKKYFH